MDSDVHQPFESDNLIGELGAIDFVVALGQLILFFTMSTTVVLSVIAGRNKEIG